VSKPAIVFFRSALMSAPSHGLAQIDINIPNSRLPFVHSKFGWLRSGPRWYDEETVLVTSTSVVNCLAAKKLTLSQQTPLLFTRDHYIRI
jgi:hypothetical protein